MTFLKNVVLLLVTLLPSLSFAYGLGLNTYPLQERRLFLSPELVALLDDASGVGVQGRLTYKLNSNFKFDGGFGVGTGDRSIRLFLGSDMEIFPDYQNQPRFSVKAFYEYAREYKNGINIIGLAPTVSKELDFWGHKGHPYVAIPVALGMHTPSSTYKTRLNLSAGLTSSIPAINNVPMIGTFEATFNLKDSYGGFMMGVAYPIQ